MGSRSDGDLLAAKLMGRWPSGAPVALAGTADDPALAADPAAVNRFDYETDQLGLACPRDAHVHRLRAPAPRVVGGCARATATRRTAAGSCSVAVCPTATRCPRAPRTRASAGSSGSSSEVVQRKWINGGQFDGLHDESDPITGAAGRDFTWQQRTVPRRFADLPRFVTVRGGEYFFVPGIAAVRYLAETSDF